MPVMNGYESASSIRSSGAADAQTIPIIAMGALASFTRSLGVVLLVPVLFELVNSAVNAPPGTRRKNAWGFLSLLVIPLGFAAYCYINYRVSGDPFKFMQYQREHWGQRLGLFFNTAAYQTENVIGCLRSHQAESAAGLWLPNVLADFGALIITALAARKLRPSYTAYFIAYYVVAIGATWLLSAPRYMVSISPMSRYPPSPRLLPFTAASVMPVTATTLLVFVGSRATEYIACTTVSFCISV